MIIVRSFRRSRVVAGAVGCKGEFTCNDYSQPLQTVGRALAFSFNGVATGVVLLHNAFALPKETLATWLIVLEMSGAVLGLFIMAGLWTPVAGMLVGASRSG